MLFFFREADDGTCLCVAVHVPDGIAGEVVMVGTGSTFEAAAVDCRRYLIEDGWPEDEATPMEQE